LRGHPFAAAELVRFAHGRLELPDLDATAQNAPLQLSASGFRNIRGVDRQHEARPHAAESGDGAEDALDQRAPAFARGRRVSRREEDDELIAIENPIARRDGRHVTRRRRQRREFGGG
jgi:hypothetical protein